jgi:UDP-N-acetylmuramate--alanine ligase
MREKAAKAHFVGAGGIGVSAIMRLFAKEGTVISGSDVHLPPEETLPPGTYFRAHDERNLPDDADVLVYSPAVPERNPEREKATRLGIKQLSYPEALAVVTSDHNTIAVSGTHGKSTTTALLGKLFETGGLRPSVIVGAEVPGWKERNLLTGDGDVFIVEACEYRRSMMNLSPQTIVLTNIELDHPDYYRDLADVKSAFRDYVAKLRQEDLLVVNNDDANSREIASTFDGIIVRYGIGDGADLCAINHSESETRQMFELVWKGTSLGSFTTELPGIYNLYNILAATSAFLSYGGPVGAIQPTLDGFHGVGRRFETLGTLGGTLIVSDYAHHPTALYEVTRAARSRYKGKRILAVFRPHHRERTLKLFDHFVEVVRGIPEMLLIEIYDVAGREEATPVSSRDIIAKIKENDADAPIEYAADLTEAETMIRAHAANFDVILVIGAGDADELAKRLIA